MAKAKNNATPLMEQYLKIKAKHKDKILLYRMGDFYETFYEDARIISRVLGIALTKRAHGKTADVPLAGFPYHALDNYLHKLVKSGKRVAICEQVEDPKVAKGIVKREVIEIVTPGAALSEKLLDNKQNNFLAAISFSDKIAGLALADVSTGEFYTSEIEKNALIEQLLSFQPKEILIAAGQKEELEKIVDKRIETIITERDDWIFSADYARDSLLNHFKMHSLKGFGLDNKTAAQITSGAVLNYLQENYKTSLEHFSEVKLLNLSRFMILDESTRQNLEIQNPIREISGSNTLLNVIDDTKTSMGGRLLKQWLNQPLRFPEDINERLNLVEELYRNMSLTDKIRQLLSECSDLERLIVKVSAGRVNGRDLKSLARSLKLIPGLIELINNKQFPGIKKALNDLSGFPDIVELIDKSIIENPPLSITEGGIIKKGYNKELDELTNISQGGKEWLLQLQEQERKRSGIHTLKIHFNKVFGYYIEVTKTNLDKVPDDYIRKQTLVNAERFITPQLKEQEDRILNAEEKIKVLEYEIFQEIRVKVSAHTGQIQNNARLIAMLDCLSSFATVSQTNNYVKPVINDKQILKIKKGRHPVVEKFVSPGEEFVPNDVYLNPSDEQIWIITGPNMAGKSTFLRQVALIVFMAQTGCFVPADAAEIGAVDRIFTRVGASDNLARGESTFLIEMNETANILNNATQNSLVLLDEVGRGTSTFDGLAIAWAVSEFLHNDEHIKAKTLFATHYHELTELAVLFPRIKNYNIAVEEWEDQVIFLRKIIPGGTDNSYGIHVAQMAGLPFRVIERAREILSNLESSETNTRRIPSIAQRRPGRAVDKNQLSIFGAKEKSEIEKRLKNVDLNNLTPIEALIQLNELKKMLNDD